jgi:hypothetical protein
LHSEISSGRTCSLHYYETSTTYVFTSTSTPPPYTLAPLQDHIFQPFEDLLPYEQFSLRLPAADIPRIQQVLAAVSEAEWQRLHAGLARWHRAFVWEAGYGWAYNLTIRSLKGRHAAWRAGLAEE